MLVIGADDEFLPALRVALARHSVYVESALATNAVETVVVTAPDLVLLVGEASRDAGRAVLSALAVSPVSSIVPVALLGEDSALSARLQAFRHGAAAVIARSPSIDAIASEVARLAREIPERGGAAAGQIGEATLAELVSALHHELRAGILSVQPADAEAPVRLVLGSGRPLAAFIDQFVARVKKHVVHAEPLEYEFDDRARGTIQLLANESRESEPPPGSIEGLRILLADDNPSRVDVVAQELRALGATVVVSNFTPEASDIARVRQVDPQVVLIGEAELEGPGYALLQRLKEDTRLRWASLLVVRWNEIWENALAVPSIDRIRGALAALGEPDRGLCDRAAIGDAFDSRLELTGPARCLRALAACRRPLRVSLENARISVDVDLSEGLVVGATARARGGEQWEGPHALAAFLVLRTGRVHVEPIQQAATTSVMATVDVALNLAEQERSPILPSLPAPAMAPEPPARVPTPVRPASPRESAVRTAPVAKAPSSGEDSVAAAPASVRAGERPKARFAITGVSRSIAAVLLGLAVIQGILIALGLTTFFDEKPETAAPGSAAARPAAPSPGGERVREALPPASAPPVPAAASAKSSAAPSERTVETPSCDDLLGAGGSSKLKSYPGADYDQLKLARRALVRGEMAEAQRGYCAAVRLDPSNANHHFELAQLLLLRRDGKAAARSATEGVRLDPGGTRGQSLLGDALALVGDDAGARLAWYRAAGLPDSPPEQQVKDVAKRSMAEAEQVFARKDYARAERFFRRAALTAPESAAAAIGLSTALLRQGEIAPALAWAERAVSLAPSDPLATLALGDAALAAGDKARAKEQFEKTVQLGHREAARRLRRLE